MRMIAFRAALLLAFALPRTAAAEAGKVPLVFIHGIKGAELREADGSLRWIGALQALSLSTPDIALEARFDESGQQPAGPLRAGPVLAKIAVIPRLVEVDVYGGWLERAARLGRPFEAFSYDWRRENTETAARFERFLEETAAKYGARQVDVVAHSMGGLVTTAVLARRPELVRRVVFASAALGGGIGFLPDLHAGVATGLNGDVAGPAVVASWASVYSFFPLDGRGALREASGAPIDVDFYDPADWERLRLGPYAEGRAPDAAFRAFFAEALRRARAFRASVTELPPGRPYPKALVVASKAHPTLEQGVRGGPKAALGWDFESAETVEGDGRIAFAHAMPPEPIEREVVLSDAEHAEILSDPAVAQKIQSFLDAP